PRERLESGYAFRRRAGDGADPGPVGAGPEPAADRSGRPADREAQAGEAVAVVLGAATAAARCRQSRTQAQAGRVRAAAAVEGSRRGLRHPVRTVGRLYPHPQGATERGDREDAAKTRWKRDLDDARAARQQLS